MTLLNEYQRRQVAEAIALAERRTDAQLVTVLARRADDYAYLPLFWAAVLALATPALLNWLVGWPGLRGLLVANVLLFIGLCVLLRQPRVAAWLTPTALLRWRAARLAHQQFREQNLESTAGATGVLIFVAEQEQHVEILVDQGAAPYLDAKVRAVLVARLTEQVRQGHTLQGFVECIEACGELLGKHLPRTHPRNELPNHLVILD
ncbi:TPM domain-containing protein [Pseudomonas promysalinigenes]|uniref:TPM domain-containing protein n=1 Tax=Pseudomonas promysalinigenes TaxID=485898 RepID=UPI00391749DD